MLHDRPESTSIRLALAVGLLLVTVVVYLPALSCGYIWDDDAYVTHNETLRTGEGLRRIWFELGAVPQYYPLVHTTFWIEYHLWGKLAVGSDLASASEFGMTPNDYWLKLAPGYHATNILLHASVSILLWRLLVLLEIPGAYLAAAIFAVHPVHVESVAWITERKNTLSALFYLASAILYLRFALSDENRPQRRRYANYVGALVFYVCALLSKTVAVTLPAALLLVICWKRRRVRRQDIVPLIPMFLIAVPMGLITVSMEKHRVGATGADWDWSFVERCLIAGRALWFYAGKLFWPVNLVFIYPRWQIDASVWWQYTFPLAAIALVVVLYALHRRIGFGPLVAVLFFGGTLFPALGFFNVYPMRFSYVADHFQYLASIGLITLVAASIWIGASLLTRRTDPARSSEHQDRDFKTATVAGVFVVAPLIVLLGWLTSQRCPVYKDSNRLWSDTWKHNPTSPMVLNNLANIRLNQGNVIAAQKLLEQAYAMKPRVVEVLLSLGNLRKRVGDQLGAEQHYREAAELDPNHVLARIEYGNILLELDRWDEARREFQATLRIDDQVVIAHMKLAQIESRSGNIADAEQHLRTAIQLDPEYSVAHLQLGILLFSQQKFDEARQSFQETLELDPSSAEAHFQLAQISLHRTDLNQAEFHLRRAIEANPRHANGLLEFGNLLIEQNRNEEATVVLRQAVMVLRQNGASTPTTRAIANYRLAEALKNTGDIEGAIEQLEEALRLREDFVEAQQMLDKLRGS